MTTLVDPYTPQRPPDVPPLLPYPPAETPALPLPLISVGEKPTWEYKRVVRNLTREEVLTENDLNELGAEGWELAGIVAASPLAYFYLKRPNNFKVISPSATC
jgi:hypothetical protein